MIKCCHLLKDFNLNNNDSKNMPGCAYNFYTLQKKIGND